MVNLLNACYPQAAKYGHHGIKWHQMHTWHMNIHRRSTQLSSARLAGSFGRQHVVLTMVAITISDAQQGLQIFKHGVCNARLPWSSNCTVG